MPSRHTVSGADSCTSGCAWLTDAEISAQTGHRDTSSVARYRAGIPPTSHVAEAFNGAGRARAVPSDLHHPVVGGVHGTTAPPEVSASHAEDVDTLSSEEAASHSDYEALDNAPAPDFEDGVFEVQGILDHRETADGYVYLVEWRGYPDTTWEHADGLASAQETIDAYWHD